MHLGEKHLESLFTIIDTWEPEIYGGLTWGRVLERFKKLHSQAPTERTLRNHSRLKVRFQQKKEQLRAGNIPLSRKPSSLAKAAEKIQQLQAKIKALELENQRIFHRLIVWQKNAMDHGLTKSQLEKPLPITQDTLHNLK
ncbi:MAG: hypothetical protein Q7L07_17025 [Pseudohongiella sp.]|nr:hypothetical protein [Pseudohongiella sp.]